MFSNEGINSSLWINSKLVSDESSTDLHLEGGEGEELEGDDEDAIQNEMRQQVLIIDLVYTKGAVAMRFISLEVKDRAYNKWFPQLRGNAFLSRFL